MNDTELRRVLMLTRHDDPRVAQRAFELLRGEYTQLIAAQDYAAFRAWCDAVWEMDQGVLWACIFL